MAPTHFHDFQTVIGPRLTDHDKIRLKVFQPVMGCIGSGNFLSGGQKTIQQTAGQAREVFTDMQLATGGLQRVPFAARSRPVIHTGRNPMLGFEQNVRRRAPELLAAAPCLSIHG